MIVVVQRSKREKAARDKSVSSEESQNNSDGNGRGRDKQVELGCVLRMWRVHVGGMV